MKLASSYIIIFCTCPDKLIAEKIASQLITKKLAACINIIPTITSIYEWQGKIEKSEEYLLIIKTKAELYEQMQTFICENHPYEIPEIIAIPITQ